ncbi:MAG: hypothetical protein AAFY14_07395 [Pseudomonadota bacterium]
MVVIVPYRSGPSLQMHVDWLDYWRDCFPEVTLANEILHKEGFAARVAQVILKLSSRKTAIADLPATRQGHVLKQLLEMPQEPLLRRIGLLWLAPVIAPELPNSEMRQRLGIRDRDDIRLALRYRDENPAHVVGSLTDHASLSVQGTLCLLAWFSLFESPLRNRLKLLFPKRSCTLDAPGERIVLVSRFMDDAEAKEGLVQ